MKGFFEKLLGLQSNKDNVVSPMAECVYHDCGSGYYGTLVHMNPDGSYTVLGCC